MKNVSWLMTITNYRGPSPVEPTAMFKRPAKKLCNVVCTRRRWKNIASNVANSSLNFFRTFYFDVMVVFWGKNDRFEFPTWKMWWRMWWLVPIPPRAFVILFWKSCKCPTLSPDGSYNNPTLGFKTVCKCPASGPSIPKFHFPVYKAAYPYYCWFSASCHSK